MTADKEEIQELILGWLGMQTEATSYAKLRDVCNAGDRILSNYAPREPGERTYSLYEYFYPLARAGLVDCRIQRGREEWALTPPIVLFRDFPDGRRKWVGINLTNVLKKEIEVGSRWGISRWTTKSNATGDGLPIVQNPSTLQLLKMFPVCRPEIFGSLVTVVDRDAYKFKFSTRNKEFISSTDFRNNRPGLYRVGDIYSNRTYLDGKGNTYALNQDCKVESDCWAKLRHCIDNKKSIATYSCGKKQISFWFDLPIMLARVLFIEQLFLDEFPDVNSREYQGITPECFEQLNRIFENNLEKVN